jgi:hypothetical protein
LSVTSCGRLKLTIQRTAVVAAEKVSRAEKNVAMAVLLVADLAVRFRCAGDRRDHAEGNVGQVRLRTHSKVCRLANRTSAACQGVEQGRIYPSLVGIEWLMGQEKGERTMTRASCWWKKGVIGPTILMRRGPVQEGSVGVGWAGELVQGGEAVRCRGKAGCDRKW